MRKSKRAPLITENDLKPENARIRISMLIPEDLLDAYREEAAKKGIGYQTLMQIKLREGLESRDLESRLSKIEKKLKIAR